MEKSKLTWLAGLWLVLGSFGLIVLLWPMVATPYLLGEDLGKDIRQMTEGDVWKKASLPPGAPLKEVIRSYRLDGLLLILAMYQLSFLFLLSLEPNPRSSSVALKALGALAVSLAGFSETQFLHLSTSTEKVLILGAAMIAMAMLQIWKRLGIRLQGKAWLLSLSSLIAGTAFLYWDKKAAIIFYIFLACAWKWQFFSTHNKRIRILCTVPLIPLMIYWTFFKGKSSMAEVGDLYISSIAWVFMLGMVRYFSLIKMKESKNTSFPHYFLCTLPCFAIIENIYIALAVNLVVCGSVFVSQGLPGSDERRSKGLAVAIGSGIVIICIVKNQLEISRFCSGTTAVKTYIEDCLKSSPPEGKPKFYVSRQRDLALKNGKTPNVTAIRNLLELNQEQGLAGFKIQEKSQRIEIYRAQDLAGIKETSVCLDPFFGFSGNSRGTGLRNKTLISVPQKQTFEFNLFGIPLLILELEVIKHQEKFNKTKLTIKNVEWLKAFFPVSSIIESKYLDKKRQTLLYREERREGIYKIDRELIYNSDTKQASIRDFIRPQKNKTFIVESQPFQDPLTAIQQIQADFKNGELQPIYAYAETGKIKYLGISSVAFRDGGKGKDSQYLIKLNPLIDKKQTALGFKLENDKNKEFILLLSRGTKEILQLRCLFFGVPFQISPRPTKP